MQLGFHILILVNVCWKDAQVVLLYIVFRQINDRSLWNNTLMLFTRHTVFFLSFDIWDLAGAVGLYFHDLLITFAAGAYSDRQGSPQFPTLNKALGGIRRQRNILPCTHWTCKHDTSRIVGTDKKCKCLFQMKNIATRVVTNKVQRFYTEFHEKNDECKCCIFNDVHNYPISIDDSNLPRCLNTLRPRQNGRHFADDIFKCTFLNENISISIDISLKFVPEARINNIPALVQIMAWRRLGDKSLSEPMIVSLLTHICVTRTQWVNNHIFRFNSIGILNLVPTRMFYCNLSHYKFTGCKMSPKSSFRSCQNAVNS